jgi:hypothetical protein
VAALTGLRDEFDATALRTLAKASRRWPIFMMMARAAMQPGLVALSG